MESSNKKHVDQDQERKVEEVHETSDMTGDYRNVAILLFLYMLQGDN